MKLQEVYASEQNHIGSWVDIGYKDPAGGDGSTSHSTSNFSYINVVSGTGTAATGTWKAASIVGLNDCQIGSTWAILSEYASNTGNVTAQASFTGVGGSACTIAGLTPNFCKVGNKTGGAGCN